MATGRSTLYLLVTITWLASWPVLAQQSQGLSAQRGAPTAEQVEKFCREFPKLIESPNLSKDQKDRYEKLYKEYCKKKPTPRPDVSEEAEGKIDRILGPECLAPGSVIRVEGEGLREGGLECRLESKGHRRTLKPISSTDRQYRYRLNGNLTLLPGPDFRVECEVKGDEKAQRFELCPKEGVMPAPEAESGVDLVPEMGAVVLRPGEAQTVEVSVRNLGQSSPANRRHRVLLMLSTRDLERLPRSTTALTPSSGEVLAQMRQWVTRLPGGGQSEAVPLVLNIPRRLPTGALYWCAVADSERTIAEYNERNNLKCLPANGEPQTVAREDLAGLFGSKVKPETTNEPDSQPEIPEGTGPLDLGNIQPLSGDDRPGLGGFGPEIERLVGETFVQPGRRSDVPIGRTEPLPDLRIDRVEVLSAGSARGRLWIAVSAHGWNDADGELPLGSFGWELTNETPGPLYGTCNNDFSSQRGRAEISRTLGGAWILTDMRIDEGRYCGVEFTFNQIGDAPEYPERNQSNNVFRRTIGYGEPLVGAPSYNFTRVVTRVSVDRQGPSWAVIFVDYLLRAEPVETVRGPYTPSEVPNDIKLVFTLADGTTSRAGDRTRGHILCHGRNSLFTGDNRRVAYLCRRRSLDPFFSLETVSLGACFGFAFDECRPEIELRRWWSAANHGVYSFRLRADSADDRPVLSDLTAEIVDVSLPHDPRTVRFIVRNEGSLIARNVRYRVRIGTRTEVGLSIGTGSIVRLEPGAAVERSFVIPRSVVLLNTEESRRIPHRNIVYVDVDQEDLILERIEGNNTAFEPIPFELQGPRGGGLRSGSTL